MKRIVAIFTMSFALLTLVGCVNANKVTEQYVKDDVEKTTIELTDVQKEFIESHNTIERLRVVENDIFVEYKEFGGTKFSKISDKIEYEIGPFNIHWNDYVTYYDEYFQFEYYSYTLKKTMTRIDYNGDVLLEISDYEEFVRYTDNGFLFTRLVDSKVQVIYTTEDESEVFLEYTNYYVDSMYSSNFNKPLNAVISMSKDQHILYYLDEAKDLHYIIIQDENVIANKVIDNTLNDFFITEDAIIKIESNGDAGVYDLYERLITTVPSSKLLDGEYKFSNYAFNRLITFYSRTNENYIVVDEDGTIRYSVENLKEEGSITSLYKLGKNNALSYYVENGITYIGRFDKNNEVIWKIEVPNHFYQGYDMVVRENDFVLKHDNEVRRIDFDGKVLGNFEINCISIHKQVDNNILCHTEEKGLVLLDEKLDTLWGNSDFEYRRYVRVTEDGHIITEHVNPVVSYDGSTPSFIFTLFDKDGNVVTTFDELYAVFNVFDYEGTTYIVGKDQKYSNGFTGVIYTLDEDSELNNKNDVYISSEYTNDKYYTIIYEYTGDKINTYKVAYE